MPSLLMKVWQDGVQRDDTPILRKVLPHEPHPAHAWLAEQDAHALWDEIVEGRAYRRHMKLVSELIDDGRQPSWTVSPRQIRFALRRFGLREAVEQHVRAVGGDLQDWWEYATAFDRWNPEVERFAQTLGISSMQLDALWELAESL